MVKGGRAREAAALAWERQGSAPDQTAFKNWAKSVLENPAVVQSKVKSLKTAMSLSMQEIKNKTKNTFGYKKAVVAFLSGCVCPGATHHWSGSGDPMCCHKEETPEEGPPAVLGWVWYLQVCSLPQQRQASSLWDRMQVSLPNRHIWHQLWDTSSRLHLRYICSTQCAWFSVMRKVLLVQQCTVFSSSWSHSFVSHYFPFPLAHLLDELAMLSAKMNCFMTCLLVSLSG